MKEDRRRGVSYFGCRNPRHVRADLALLAENGFTYVVHTVSENDLAYHRGTLEEIFTLTHEAGLEVHADPWGVGRLFGGEAFSDLLARKPELRQVDCLGRPLPCLCPGRPEVEELMAKWVEVVAGAGADWVFIDEPHLHISREDTGALIRGDRSLWSCRCPGCVTRYEAWAAEPMPVQRTQRVEAFRRRTVLDLIRRLASRGREAGLKVSLCVLPPEIGGDTALPLEAASTLKEIDVLGSDPYWIHAGLEAGAFVGRTAETVRRIARDAGMSPQVWIQGFRIPAGREPEILTAVAAARQAGVEDLAVWGFEACGHMSYLKPDNPERTWSAILKAFSET